MIKECAASSGDRNVVKKEPKNIMKYNINGMGGNLNGVKPHERVVKCNDSF
jgi:hypothetical protein